MLFRWKRASFFVRNVVFFLPRVCVLVRFLGRVQRWNTVDGGCTDNTNADTCSGAAGLETELSERAVVAVIMAV